MKRMHSSRIVVQALPAPGAPDDCNAKESTRGCKLRKLSSKAAISRGHAKKIVDDNTDHMLGAPLRIMSQEHNSNFWSPENIKSRTQAGRCIEESSSWKVTKRRSILQSKSDASENNARTCEQVNAASLPKSGKNGDFIEVSNAASEMMGPQRSPRVEVGLTYPRKRRKNSSAPENSLTPFMQDAASSSPIIENKTKTTSSAHCQVPLSYCSDSFPKEKITLRGTLLMGVQQLLLEKTADDSLQSEACNKKETIQVDNQIESIGRDKFRISTDNDVETCSDRCSDISKDDLFVPLDSKFVTEVENQDETVSNVGNTLTAESGDFIVVNNAVSELMGLQICPRAEVVMTSSMMKRNHCSGPSDGLPSIMTDSASSSPIKENQTKVTSSDHYHVPLSLCFDDLPEEKITQGGTLVMDVQQLLLEKPAEETNCNKSSGTDNDVETCSVRCIDISKDDPFVTLDSKSVTEVENRDEIVSYAGNTLTTKSCDFVESPTDSKVENYEQDKRNETESIVNVAPDIEFAKESSGYVSSCVVKASNDTHSMVTMNEHLNGGRQSFTEDGPQSRASVFVDGKTQITNMGIISPLGRRLNTRPCKKLLVLDVNGLLADIVPLHQVPYTIKADIIVSGKAVFKRPFHEDFLQFCFERFNVGVWSSRIKRNMELVLDHLLGDAKHRLLFCWDQSHCTDTGYPVVGRRRTKPIILKKLKKLWDKHEPDLPWEKGEFDESNTLLLDDSPHKALCNPPNTAIFPHSYHYRDWKDDSLGPRGDLRVYLEGLSMAENVQKYVECNPFGQRAITERNASWRYYRRVIEAATYIQEGGAYKFSSYPRQNRFSSYGCRY